MGDLVLAYDEATRSTGLFTVTDVLVHIDPAQVHLTIGGEHVETTPEHPFYTQERGWVDAGDLWRGAQVRQADGSFDAVWPVQVETEPQLMYNLTVAQANTFFVSVGRWLIIKKGGISDIDTERFHINEEKRFMHDENSDFKNFLLYGVLGRLKPEIQFTRIIELLGELESISGSYNQIISLTYGNLVLYITNGNLYSFEIYFKDCLEDRMLRHLGINCSLHDIGLSDWLWSTSSRSVV